MGVMHALLIPTLLAFLAAIVLTPLAAAMARRFGIVDIPGGRRIHPAVTPRLGGLAVIASFFLVLLIYLPRITPHFRASQIPVFALASLLLLLVGLLDDRRGVAPGWQLLSHVIAALALVSVGMGIEEISNPFGGKLALDQIQLTIPGIDPIHHLRLPADLITVGWVVLVVNAINWLDGLDGLATGVGGISAVTIALLSLTVAVNQPHVALLAMILTGSLAGFLVYNFQPAKVFLGTTGSTFIGFTIATLAIISGGKVATAVLVLGFPILDALAIIVRRSVTTRAPWKADATHLHHQLLARGFSVRRTVLFIYALCAAFGGLALMAGTTQYKVYAFLLLAVMMVGLLVWLARGPKPAKPPAK